MKNKIIKYLKEQFGQNTNHHFYCLFPECKCTCKDFNDIDENTELISGGYLDSFSLIVVVVWLERTFKIKIPEKLATVENMETVNKMIRLING